MTGASMTHDSEKVSLKVTPSGAMSSTIWYWTPEPLLGRPKVEETAILLLGK